MSLFVSIRRHKRGCMETLRKLFVLWIIVLRGDANFWMGKFHCARGALFDFRKSSHLQPLDKFLLNLKFPYEEGAFVQQVQLSPVAFWCTFWNCLQALRKLRTSLAAQPHQARSFIYDSKICLTCRPRKQSLLSAKCEHLRSQKLLLHPPEVRGRPGGRKVSRQSKKGETIQKQSFRSWKKT